jgi:large subunit ribosomal protein L35
MAKMKLKTLSGAKKRFKLTASGKVKRSHAYRRHILTKKTTKVTRGYRMPSYCDKTNEAAVKKMLPYG